MQIAEAYLQKNDRKKAFKIADSLSYSKERDAFILKIARSYYRSGDHQLAIKTAEGSSYSSERDELIKKMRKGLPV